MDEEKKKDEKSPEDYQLKISSGGILRDMGFMKMYRTDGGHFFVTMNPAQLKAHAESCTELAKELEKKNGKERVDSPPRTIGPVWNENDKPGKLDISHTILKGTKEQLSKRLDKDLSKMFDELQTVEIPVKNSCIKPLKAPHGEISEDNLLNVLESIEGNRIKTSVLDKNEIRKEYDDHTFELDVRFSDNVPSLMMIETDGDTVYIVWGRKR